MSENNEIVIIKKGEGYLIMREHVGDFGSDETTVKGTLSIAMNRAPIIEFENGDKVAFSWNYLINRAIEALEEYNAKEVISGVKTPMEEAREFWNKANKTDLKGKQVPSKEFKQI